MGIELIGIAFGLEERLGVRLRAQEIVELSGWDFDAPITEPIDITVGQLNALLLERRELMRSEAARRPLVQQRVEQALRDLFLDGRLTVEARQCAALPHHSIPPHPPASYAVDDVRRRLTFIE